MRLFHSSFWLFFLGAAVLIVGTSVSVAYWARTGDVVGAFAAVTCVLMGDAMTDRAIRMVSKTGSDDNES